jgi:hypothetical protein
MLTSAARETLAFGADRHRRRGTRRGRHQRGAHLALSLERLDAR